MPFDSDVQ